MTPPRIRRQARSRWLRIALVALLVAALAIGVYSGVAVA